MPEKDGLGSAPQERMLNSDRYFICYDVRPSSTAVVFVLHERREFVFSEMLHYRELRQIMRSGLVYEAGLKIENRFLLATTAMQATRKLHVSSTRTEDTVNRVFTEVAKGRYAHGNLPEVVPPPAIDLLLITPAA